MQVAGRLWKGLDPASNWGPACMGMTGAPARESWLRPELAAPVPAAKLSAFWRVPIVREEELGLPNPWNALVIERRRQETPIFPSPEEFPEQRDGWKGVSVVVPFSGFCHRHPRSEPPSIGTAALTYGQEG